MRMRRGAWGLTAAVGALALSCGLAGAGDWPRFRGPNGTGVAADKDVPVQWTPQDGLLWKVPIPGKGNSSPVIAGNRLFLESATDDAKERLLLCLDAATGKTLWTRTVPGGPAPPRGLGPKNQNTLASSTPVVEDGRVFALFWDGKEVSLHAFSVEGEPLWKQDLGPFKSQHGPGFSPMAHDGKVFVMNDQDGSAVLLAFDARTGKRAWEVKRKAFRACYSTPFVRATEDGSTELVVTSTAGITGYDPKTGAENWSYTWSFTQGPLRTVASSIAANGLVFAHGGDGDGRRHLIAVRLGGKGDVTATSLVWENRKVFPYVPCLLASGDHLYSVNDTGTAACHVARTGEEVWSKRLAGPVTASPILVDGKVYAIDESGEVYVFEAAPTFNLLAKNSVGEPVLASPAVADGRLYIRGREHLFCIAKTPAK